MIPKNSKKIIMHLLRRLEPRNINQISRELNISVGSVFKVLNELETNALVLAGRIGNAKYFRLNFESIETIRLCELLLLEEKRSLKGYAKIYASEIEGFKDADLIILFGSILKNNDFNDVDVLFVTDNVKKVTKFCLDISKIRSKPVSPLILKKEGLISEIKRKKDSILNIIKTGVVLKGESLFLEVIKNV